MAGELRAAMLERRKRDACLGLVARRRGLHGGKGLLLRSHYLELNACHITFAPSPLSPPTVPAVSSMCSQWKGEVPAGLPDWPEDELVHLEEELSDVLIYLVRLSDRCGIDLAKYDAVSFLCFVVRLWVSAERGAVLPRAPLGQMQHRPPSMMLRGTRSALWVSSFRRITIWRGCERKDR